MPAKVKPWLPLFLLLLAVLSLFWPALLHPYSILFPTFSPFSDVMVIHWPKARLVAESWQAGEGLPYWTPLILSGMPLAANQLAMLFYPPAWLLLFFPTEPVFNFLFVLHLVWGGTGIYLLLRKKYGLSAIAALLGTLTFTLNGKGLAHVAGGHASMVGAVAWMPWAVLGLHVLLEKGGEEAEARGDKEARRWGFSRSSLGGIALVAISLAMQIVTHTLPVIYSVYLLVAMTLWHVVTQQFHKPVSLPIVNHSTSSHASRRLIASSPHVSRFTRSSIYTLVPLLVAFVLAGLLGAVQLLPLLELAQFSNRSLSLSQATEFALNPVQLIVGLLLPTAQAGHEYVIYMGLIPLLLAFLALTRPHHSAWFYGLLLVFAILFALGPHNPLHSLFYYAVPGFRWVRTPARIFLVAGLAAAVLAGLGADRLLKEQWSPAAKKWFTRLTVVITPVALLVGLGFAFSLGQAHPGYRSALALSIFIPAGLLLILLRVQRVLSAHLSLALLGFLLFLDLGWFDASMLRFVPLDEALSPGRDAAAYLAQEPGYFRVYSPSYSLPMQTAAAARLNLVDGVEPVHLAVYDQYMARAGGYNDAGFSVTIPTFNGPLETALQDVKPDLKLLGLLNVTYLASAFPMNWPGLTLETEVDGIYIYRNEQALPRAWVAYQAGPIQKNWLAQLEAIPDVANIVLVENQNVNQSTLNTPYSTAEIIDYAADRIEIETEINRPGWLVLSEIWYPGWQATVNGSAAPVEKVDGLLRGVYLAQPGLYQVTLTYHPRSVLWGGWISLMTTLSILVGLFVVFALRKSSRNSVAYYQ